MTRASMIAAGIVLFLCASSATAAACTATGFGSLTAALANPTAPVTGEVNATGCNIGVYYDHNLAVDKGLVDNAYIHGANYYGVFVNGDQGAVSVSITDSIISNIGEVPFNGAQHGVAVYYRAFLPGGGTSGTISGNQVSLYQKGGIVANGRGTNVAITDNTVTGLGPVAFIAQNGIQVGFGATASVMRNAVSENSYTGFNYAASGGIIVVGGVGYGSCPDGNACPYTVGARIVGNTVSNNDVGIWLSNIDASYNAPTSATNVKVVNNIISSNGVNNIGAYGTNIGYQAGVADQGNNDKIITNNISGTGYDPNSATATTPYIFPIDADTSFTNRPKVHANTVP